MTMKYIENKVYKHIFNAMVMQVAYAYIQEFSRHFDAEKALRRNKALAKY